LFYFYSRLPGTVSGINLSTLRKMHQNLNQ
jgi:hypothetical protein